MKTNGHECGIWLKMSRKPPTKSSNPESFKTNYWIKTLWRRGFGDWWCRIIENLFGRIKRKSIFAPAYAGRVKAKGKLLRYEQDRNQVIE
jgi:hypothetical protein